MGSHFPQSGEVFVGRYQIDSVLNQGGFGRVYKATQLELQRSVAIKILQPARRIGFNDDSKAEARRLEIVAKRFEREAQVVSHLRDPHTVMMYDYGTTPDGLLYMVLEYVDGLPLDRVVEESAPMEAGRAVKITKQVLSSLQEAHVLGMLHRDIKPANIMLYEHVGRRDQVKVLDFGLAKSIDDPKFTAENPDLTDAEVLIGTPRYMSPEQIRGDKMTSATDIYSLGLVLYEMLTGHKAVRARSTMNTLARHINDVPISLPAELQIDDDLREIVHLMLEKDMNRRLSSAEQALAMFDAWEDRRKSGSFPGLDAVDVSQDYLPEIVDFSEVSEEFSADLAFDDSAAKKRLGIAALIALIALIFGGVVIANSGEQDPPDEVATDNNLASPDKPDDPVLANIDPDPIDLGMASESISDAIDSGTLDAENVAMEFEAADLGEENEVAQPAEKVQKRKKRKRKKKTKPTLRTLK